MQPAKLIAALALLLAPAAQASVRDIAWKNYTYPAPDGNPSYGLSMNAPSAGFRLRNGMARFPANSSWSYVKLTYIAFGDVTGDGIEDVAIGLYAKSQGTQSASFVYVYTGQPPRVIAKFATGDRSDHGLYGLTIQNSQLILDLADPELAPDCCSNAFFRTPYRWNGKNFAATGPIWRHRTQLDFGADLDEILAILQGAPQYQRLAALGCTRVHIEQEDATKATLTLSIGNPCNSPELPYGALFTIHLKTGRVFQGSKEIRTSEITTERTRVFAPQLVE